MVVKALARYLALIFCACVSAAAANFYGVTDPHMGQYEGFWETKSGARGRVTAQVRPLSNARGAAVVIRTLSFVTELAKLTVYAALLVKNAVSAAPGTVAGNQLPGDWYDPPALFDQ